MGCVGWIRKRAVVVLGEFDVEMFGLGTRGELKKMGSW